MLNLLPRSDPPWITTEIHTVRRGDRLGGLLHEHQQVA
jgi:hypothetical protein